MRRDWMLLLAAFVVTIGLAGCGSKSAETETTIEVKKNGTVVHTIVEAFSESYYDLEQLKTMMQEACDAYNETAGQKAVSIESAEVTEGVVTVVMKYKDAASYAGFNKQALFAGTVKGAFDAGYNLDVTLLSAREEGETAGKQELLTMGEKNMVIVREDVRVKVWDKILYHAQDALPTEDSRTVTVTDADTLTYIVFE